MVATTDKTDGGRLLASDQGGRDGPKLQTNGEGFQRGYRLDA